MHWFSMRPCAKISVLLCMKVCWCQKEYIFSTFSIKIRHEKSSYWIDLLSTSGCSLGASWSIAGEQVSHTTPLNCGYSRPNELDLNIILPVLVISAVDPDQMSTSTISYTTPVCIFSVRLDDNKLLSLLRKQETCHSEVTTGQAFKGSNFSNNILSF